MSNTPETQEAVGLWRQGKINIFDEMARLERERDEAREALQSFVQKMHAQAAVFKREDLRDNSRWSIFNEGRAQALEKMAEEVEEVK